MSSNHLSPKDVVPALRPDLNVATPPTGTGAEVIRVGPAESKDRMTMHGFEFSIARMLDGKRTVEDVMVNCARLGLPLNLPALEGFLQQLQAHNLLSNDPNASMRLGLSPWLKRQPWNEKVRESYRSAVRAAREGDLDESQRHLDALLKVSPHNTEGLRLRDWIAAHRDSPDPRGAFQQLFHDVEQQWMKGDVATVKPLGVYSEKAARPSVFPFVALGIGVAFIAAALLVPLPRSANASVQLLPVNESTMTSPHTGTLAKVMVKEGDVVKQGAVLFSFDEAETQARLSAAKQSLEDARVPLRAQAGITREGRPLAVKLKKAEAEQRSAQAALAAAQKKNDGEEPNEATKTAEARFVAATAAVMAARGELDAIAQPTEEQTAEFTRLQSEVATVEGQLKEMNVTAPAAGTVREVNFKDGQQVNADQTLLKIEDTSQMKMVAQVTPRQASKIQPGEKMTVEFGPNQRVVTTVDSVSGYEIAAALPNENGMLQTGSQSADLELKPMSVVNRMK